MSPVPFPEKVMLQTTSRCNASCRFCPYPQVSETLPQGTMDDELFRKLVDELADHPQQVQRLMLYLMNEPLLDPQIVDRINYAKQRCPWVPVHILTNGSLLTEKRGQALIESGLDWIGISVHGFSPGAYNEAMGLKRDVTYRRVERFVEQARTG
jgi:MoaA/NifB/PqqE/SkfB family radical SAM enzyme